MNFEYSEEQQLLANSVNQFITKDYTFEARKEIIDSPSGYSDRIWATFAEMGLLGLPFGNAYGGFGGNAVDLMPVMEAIGEGLVVEPFLSTVGVGGRLIARGGSPMQRNTLLPAIVEGKLKLAFAHSERGARYDLDHVTTSAKKTDGGYTIDGEKSVVLHAPQADKLIVSARTAGKDSGSRGISIFILDRNAPGVSLKTYRTADNLRAADVRFSGVNVPADALLGKEGKAYSLIEEVVDYATALLCSEAVGAIKFANEATLTYLKTRKQFGVPIGNFQVLQHRMVDMMISYEQAKSMASVAAVKVESAKADERKRVVSAAKIKIVDACRHVSQESVQLHGGMGMTEELKVSHTFRRLTTIAQAFGDADYHLERFAACEA
ncbi:MAG: pimeloyl-CoA dehydrogenase small subunit [Deltaproteobacteria bacterium]|nr:pimeloyl-CoA dehydrogenase small subunit [Deltaproteobacteria bacterium]